MPGNGMGNDICPNHADGIIRAIAHSNARWILSRVYFCWLAAMAWGLNEAHALAPSEVFARSALSVVVLESHDNTGRASGVFSATLIAPDTVVTVCSGLDLAAGLRVVRDGQNLAARLQARDRNRDLCLLDVPGLGGRTMALATGGVVTGSRVYAVSNALGLGVGISDGVLSGQRQFHGGEYLQFSAPVSPGSEGGALVDKQGNLLGIIDYRRRDGQNVNFAMPAAWIEQVRARAVADTVRQQRYDKAAAWVAGKDWDALLQHTGDWIKMLPDDTDAWGFRIRAALEKKLPDEQLRSWQALYRIDPSQRTHRLGLGWQLAQHRQFDEALALAQKLVADSPADGGAWYLLGILQQAKGNIDEAEKSLMRAIEYDPWLIDAYQNIARISQARGNSVLAIAIWQRLAGLRSSDANAQWGLINAYLLAGKPKKAWVVVERLSETLSADFSYWYWRGRTLAALEANDAACAAYRKSLDIKNDNAWAWGGIGYARTEQKRLSEAIAAFREARRLAPDNEEWTYQLAIALKDGGRSDEALSLTSGLVASSPELARNWRQHGFVLAILDRPEESVPALERSLQIEPRQAKVWSALIEVNHQRQKPAEARQAYEKLRAFDSAAAETMYREVILPDEVYKP